MLLAPPQVLAQSEDEKRRFRKALGRRFVALERRGLASHEEEAEEQENSTSSNRAAMFSPHLTPVVQRYASIRKLHNIRRDVGGWEKLHSSGERLLERKVSSGAMLARSSSQLTYVYCTLTV